MSRRERKRGLARFGALFAMMSCVSVGANAADGAKLYATHCIACHQDKGLGLPGMAPPLRSDIWKLMGEQAPLYFTRVVLDGMTGVALDGEFFPGPMMPWPSLSDTDLAAIAAYVLNDLNAGTWAIDAEKIAQLRKTSLSKADLLMLRGGS